MIENIINRFFEDPIGCSLGIALILIVIIIIPAIAIKLVGNPISYIIDRLIFLLPLVIKELKGQAGITGIVNVILAILLFILSLAFLMKLNIITFLLPENINSALCGLIVLFLFVFVFLISLRMVGDTERMNKLYK